MNFNYGGQRSEDYGVIIGRTGGIDNIPLIANENLIYDQTPNKYYHYGVTKELLEFNWTIVPVKGYWENGQLDRVVKWLNKDDFTKFTRDDWPGKVLYLKPIDMTLGGLSLHSSYIDATFINISPYYYSEVETKFFKKSKLHLTNDSKYDIIMSIEILSNGGNIILSNGESQILIKDTIKGDTIVIDNHNGIIYSDLDDDILSKYNGETLNTRYQNNNISINGSHKCKVVYQQQFDKID